MKKLQFAVLSACLLASSAFAEDAAATTAPAAPSMQQCSKELLLSYFPEDFVSNTLKKFNVPEDKWAAIKSGLSQKDKEVVGIVEKRAAEMNPNPLKDPASRAQAVKLFRETLLQLFSDVLNQNGISDQKQIQAMLDDVQQQKASRFAQCMSKAKQNDNDDDSDDDDDDDDDSDDDDDAAKMKGNG